MDLKGNPFYLSDEQIEWVEKTKSEMTQDEKVGQLFLKVSDFFLLCVDRQSGLGQLVVFGGRQFLQSVLSRDA